jgi:uncharacterized protein YbjQ (UPF0145 family)
MSDSEPTSVMLVVTTSTIAGYRIVETKGAALGVVTFYDPLEELRSALPQSLDEDGVWREVIALGETTWEFGKNPQDFKDVQEAALAGREHAIKAMKVNAAEFGANAVIDLRFDSCLLNTKYSVGGIVAHGIREIVAYGTAVVVEKIEH